MISFTCICARRMSTWNISLIPVHLSARWKFLFTKVYSPQDISLTKIFPPFHISNTTDSIIAEIDLSCIEISTPITSPFYPVTSHRNQYRWRSNSLEIKSGWRSNTQNNFMELIDCVVLVSVTLCCSFGSSANRTNASRFSVTSPRSI